MGKSSEPLRPRISEDTSGSTQAPTEAAIRVLVVDDHDLVRMAIRTLVADEPKIEIIAEADNVERGRSVAAATRPDLILLDVHLPDGDGLDLCREAVQNQIGVVVLTAYAGDELIIEAMRAGASGYVLKQDPVEEILAAIHTVGTGGAHFSDTATPQMLAVIATGGLPEDPIGHLTERERDLLSLLGEGLSNRQIAERLYLGERTVKNYVSRLLRKLDFERRAEAAAFHARLESQREMRRYSLGVRS